MHNFMFKSAYRWVELKKRHFFKKTNFLRIQIFKPFLKFCTNKKIKRRQKWPGSNVKNWTGHKQKLKKY